MVDQDPSELNLDVYDTKEGLWTPEIGALGQPEGWDFLPSGDAFVTRRAKTGGACRKLWRPGDATARTVGYWAFWRLRRRSKRL